MANTNSITLEDDFNDCLSKAIRGHGCPISGLAHAAGTTEKSITACLNGKQNDATLHSIAPHLQLSVEKLINLKSYKPAPQLVPGLTTITSPFGHIGVNAFLITSGDQHIIFDTGSDAKDLIFLAPGAQNLFITHEHPDHIAELSKFSKAKHHLPNSQPHGHVTEIADLVITALDVSGHCTPARAYLIEGLEKPVCIVGDSIFAGSIGGCPSTETYSTALANITDHIFALSDNTILCPGHGPLTTVAQEKRHNPFF